MCKFANNINGANHRIMQARMNAVSILKVLCLENDAEIDVPIKKMPGTNPIGVIILLITTEPHSCLPIR